MRSSRVIMNFDTAERLELAAKMIQVLDGRRIASGDENLGSNIERMIVSRELDELESDILSDPGPLARYISPVRNRVRGQRK